MKNNRPYKNAPIVEAALEFIIDPPVKSEEGKYAGNSFSQIQKTLQEEYPIKKDIQAANISFQISSGSHTTNTQQVLCGIRLESADKKLVFQALDNRFVFSQLAPYTEWADFINETQKLWNVYKKALKPKNITRIGLRYINQIVFENKDMKLENYFELYPHIPKPKKYPLSNFIVQIQLSLKENQMATVRQVLAPPRDGKAAVILDIDVFTQKKFAAGHKDVWNVIEKMRTNKNTLFEDFITPHTRKEFDQ